MFNGGRRNLIGRRLLFNRESEARHKLMVNWCGPMLASARSAVRSRVNGQVCSTPCRVSVEAAFRSAAVRAISV